MARQRSKSPTDRELDILRVLWSRGPSTVREVHETLRERHGPGTGYTTTLKLLQVMTEKGIVRRDVSRRSHVYVPADSEESVQRQLLQKLLDGAFEGSTRKLVLQALSVQRASREELAEIRRLIEEKIDEHA